MCDSILMWTVLFTDRAVAFGASLFLQSTIIIAIGLGIARLARSRGALAQSFILRVFLAAVFICPTVSLIVESTGGRVLHIPIPRASVDSRPPAVFSPHRIPAGSPSVPITGGIPQKNDWALTEHRSLPGKAESPSMSRTDRPAAAPSNIQPVIPAHHMPATGMQEREHSPSSGTRAMTGRFLLYLAFTLAWGAVTFLLLGRLFVHAIHMRYIRRTAYPAAPHYIGTCHSIARELKVHPPDVLQSPLVQCPFLAGFFRPAIFLPLGENEKEFSSREVLFHELVHLTHYDTLWNLLHRIAAALIPFQPLLWILSRVMEETDDYVCDDFVLTHRGNLRSYVLCLVGAAASIQPVRNGNPLEVGFLSFSSTLRRRVERILDTSRAITIRVGTRMLVMISSLCLCITFLSGLVGFRGNGFAQGRKISKTFSQGGLAATLQTLAMVQKQAAETLKPQVQDMEPHDETTGIPGGSALIKAIPLVEESAPSHAAVSDDASGTDDQNTPESPSADSVILSPVPVAETLSPVFSESGTAITPTLREPPESYAVKTASGDSLQTSDRPVLSASAAAREETSVASTGQVMIAVPNSCEGTLKESLEAGQQSPVWSPTGKLIAFMGTNGVGIWVVSANGGKPDLILDNSDDFTSNEVISSTETAHIIGFTPDGSEITYVRYILDTAASGVKKGTTAESTSLLPVIESVSFLTKERRTIAKNASEGCWNRDGRYFVYVESDSYGIGILDVLTGKQQLISETGLSPCMTPEGASIIYVDQSGTNKYDLYRVPLAGGKSERLTTDGNWWKPEISPDGEWVLCTGFGIPQYSQFALLRAFNLQDHMSYYIMVQGAKAAEMGTWSPSGRQFCYTRYTSEMENGSILTKPAIYIDNFQPSDFTQPSAETVKPYEFNLVGNYPNPFNPSTTIQFSLSSTGPAELDIYNMIGQKIRSLVSGPLEAGIHSVVWNGRDRNNIPVSSGIYMARLKMGKKVETRRMTLVK